MGKTHSFPRAAEFRAEPQNFSFAAEFKYFRGISQNFAQVENSLAISTIFELTTYFYHGNNQTKLLKAVGSTNSYRTIVNKRTATRQTALLKKQIGNFLCMLLA